MTFLHLKIDGGAVVLYTCNPSTQGAEAGGSGVQDSSQVNTKFKASLGYT